MTVDQLVYTGSLVIETCPTCQIRHGIPSELQQRALERPKDMKVYCPLGHWWWYLGTTMQAKLDQAKADAEFQRRQAVKARAEAEAERVRSTAAIAETTRTRKRIAGGACPCCNRTFTNLARHMNGQHPDFLGMPADMPSDFRWWSNVRAVSEVVRRSGEPLTPPQVLGRLVLAGRRSDTEKSTRGALYNASYAGHIRRVGASTFAAVPTA